MEWGGICQLGLWDAAPIGRQRAAVISVHVSWSFTPGYLLLFGLLIDSSSAISSLSPLCLNQNTEVSNPIDIMNRMENEKASVPCFIRFASTKAIGPMRTAISANAMVKRFRLTLNVLITVCMSSCAPTWRALSSTVVEFPLEAPCVVGVCEVASIPCCVVSLSTGVRYGFVFILSLFHSAACTWFPSYSGCYRDLTRGRGAEMQQRLRGVCADATPAYSTLYPC